MKYHIREFEENGLQAHWLEGDKARQVHSYALEFSAKGRVGLSIDTVTDIEAHTIDSESTARDWIRKRFGDHGKIHVVFGPDEVAVIDARLLIDRWQDMFLPGRDDAVVLNLQDNSVLLFSHEEILEYGLRIDV